MLGRWESFYGGHVEKCPTRQLFTAVIAANHFQNYPIGRSA